MMLQVENLAAAYAGIEALRGVSLRVETGEMVALIGANGAGKSTLLNCLSGTVRARRGTIVFNGENIAGTRPHRVARRGLLQVPEGRQILVDLTVEENLQLGALARGGRKSAFDILDVFRLFPILEERRLQKGGTLSGGQQQMLAVARGLMAKPKLLLLDEPSLGLAPLIVQNLFGTIREIRALGTTILLVEQNANMALSVADRGYVLETGSLTVEGSPQDLLDNEEVRAAYLGGHHG